MKKLTAVFLFLLLSVSGSKAQCLPVDEINEDFNSANANSLPVCWSSIIRGQNVSQYAKITTTIGTGFQNTNAVMLNNADSAPSSDIILVTPDLGNLGAGTHRLKFYAKASTPVNLQVGVLNNNTSNAIFTVIDGITTQSGNNEYTVDFDSYTGPDHFIGIRLNASVSYTVAFVDNIRWEIAPLCADVTNIIVPATTPATATVAWASAGMETQWDVVFGGISVTDPQTLTPISPAPVAQDALLTGLEMNTAYKVWVRSVCGSPDGNGAWIGPVTFTTPCVPVTELNEDCESSGIPALPNCWGRIIRGNAVSESAEVKSVDYGAHSGSKAIQLNNNEAGNVSDIILVSPNLGNLSAGTHRLKFFADSDTATDIEVGTLSSNTAAADFTPFQNVSIQSSYHEYIVDFVPYSGTDTHIGFRINSVDYATIYLDDIRWELAPLCPDVSEITIPEVTVNSATVNWVSGGMEAQWDVVYGDFSITDPGTLIPISPAPVSETATLTGLTENTAYKVWVRSVCSSPNGNGDWIGPITFSTECSPITVFSENFDSVDGPALPSCWTSIVRGNSIAEDAKVAVVNYSSYSATNSAALVSSYSSGQFDLILVSPKLGNLADGTHRLKFYSNGYSTGSIEIGTLDSNMQNAAFIPFATLPTPTSYTANVVDFTAYEGTDQYIGIRYNSDTMYNTIFIDNVIWEPAPLCPDVTGITVSDTATSSAAITWNDSGATNWQVVYGADSVTDPDSLTPDAILSSSATQITGLTDFTAYKVWVRSVCGSPDGNGAWIGPVSFTTECLPTTLLNETFDTVQTPNLPDCWSSIIRGENVSTNAKITTVGFTGYLDTASVMFNNDTSDFSSDLILVSPNLSSLPGNTHNLKFYANAYAPMTLEIGTLENNNQDAAFTVLSTITTTTSYAEYSVDFSSFTGTDQYIGIRMYINGNYNVVFVDNIRWVPKPACPDVTGVTVPSVTTDTATVNWTAGGSEPGWNIVYGGASVTNPDTLTPISPAPADISTELTGLTENTTYKVWVRSVCSMPDINGAWVGPVIFSTTCSPVTELNEDLESVNVPGLPDCWTSIIRGSTVSADATVKSVSFGAHSGANAIQMVNDEVWNPSDIILVSPNLDNLSAGTHSLSFYADSAVTSSIEIGTLNENTQSAVFTSLGALAIQTSYNTYTFDFSAYSGTDTYIGIRMNANDYSTILLDDIHWQSTLSTGAFDKSGFVCYPNPVEDVLNLSCPDTISNVMVFNLLGQKVLEYKINSTNAHIDMSGLKSGSYLLKATSENQTGTIKILKK